MAMSPIGVVVQRGPNFANISWMPVEGADMYAVNLDGRIFSPLYNRSITVNNLAPNAEHHLQVASHAYGEWSSYSKPVTFTL